MRLSDVAKEVESKATRCRLRECNERMKDEEETVECERQTRHACRVARVAGTSKSGSRVISVAPLVLVGMGLSRCFPLPIRTGQLGAL